MASDLSFFSLGPLKVGLNPVAPNSALFIDVGKEALGLKVGRSGDEEWEIDLGIFSPDLISITQLGVLVSKDFTNLCPWERESVKYFPKP